jgi:small subunit ribosomal protein S1
MTTRNDQQTSSINQPQHLGSPFAALTLADGKVALTTSETAPVKTPAQVAPVSAPKPIARKPMAMPRRAARINTMQLPAASAIAVSDEEASQPMPAAKIAASTETLPPATVGSSAPAPVALTGWELLEQHKKTGKAIRGNVTRVIHSQKDQNAIVGIKVRVAGLEGFVPFRMLGLSPIDAEHSVTLEMGFRVVELEKGTKGEKDRIILNRQLVAAEEKSATLIKNIKMGDTVSGIIRNIKPFGAFVDIEGASALIRVTDLPQSKITSVKVGDKVQAIVVKADAQQNQLGLSIRHYAVSQLAVGAEFTGLVKNEESFGVFVQLNQSVDGLVHVSQFGDFSPAKGDTVTVKVLSTNKAKGQVQLALLAVNAAQAQ